MDVNLRRLRYFVAVADKGHFGRAAESVHLSATALSEQIRKLEAEFDVKLFDRNPRGAQLTDIGAELATKARSVLVQTQHLTDLLKQRRLGDGGGRLRLGFVTLAAGEATPRLVERLKANSPGLELELVHLSYARQVDAVLDGDVDASIARGPIEPSAAVCLDPLGSESRMIMVSTRHALARRRSVTRQDLAQEPRVTTDGVPETWRRWWSLDPNPDGSTPPYGPLVHSFDEQIEVAASGIALSIVPATAASVYRRNDLRFIPICDAESSQIFICSLAGNVSPMLARLRSICAQMLRPAGSPAGGPAIRALVRG
jgi:DNA-binding transcriptional LysR family regulator